MARARWIFLRRRKATSRCVSRQHAHETISFDAGQIAEVLYRVDYDIPPAGENNYIW